MKTGNRNICSVMTIDTAICQFAVTIRYCHDTSTFDDAATKFSFTTDSILSHSLTFLTWRSCSDRQTDRRTDKSLPIVDFPPTWKYAKKSF
jgi:hypothetical protein